MKNKKLLLIFLLIFFLLIGIFGFLYLKVSSKSKVAQNEPNQVVKNAEERSFLLEGYPEDIVPLFKSVKVSSSNFFVNNDPGKFDDYFGTPVNYYNVVFETEASPEEMLSYYRSLMSEVNSDPLNDETVEGKIDKYKVSASHYGNDPANYGYLQVYLPPAELAKSNPYFKNYPGIVEVDQLWVEHESSFGYLNQNGGEIEYWQYFPLTEDQDGRESLIKAYQDKYQDETDYTYDDKTGLMRFMKDGYSVNMTFSRNHGRIYLMIRTEYVGQK